MTRKLTAGAVFEASTDTSGPITTIMRKHHLLYLTTCRLGLLVNNRFAISVVVTVVVATVVADVRGFCDRFFTVKGTLRKALIVAIAHAAASWTFHDTIVAIAHAAASCTFPDTIVAIGQWAASFTFHDTRASAVIYRSSLHTYTHTHIRSITSWTQQWRN